MGAAHSPGPWAVDEEYVIQAGDQDTGLCSVMNMDVGGDKGWYRGPITEANARLMAAAPTLLKACRLAIGALKGREHDGFLRDAIEAATGERP